jgi:hypothetical protein
MYKVLVDTLVANTSCASAAKKKKFSSTRIRREKSKNIFCVNFLPESLTYSSGKKIKSQPTFEYILH